VSGPPLLVAGPEGRGGRKEGIHRRKKKGKNPLRFQFITLVDQEGEGEGGVPGKGECFPLFVPRGEKREGGVSKGEEEGEKILLSLSLSGGGPKENRTQGSKGKGRRLFDLPDYAS